jgi:hypothetical protein
MPVFVTHALAIAFVPAAQQSFHQEDRDHAA